MPCDLPRLQQTFERVKRQAAYAFWGDVQEMQRVYGGDKRAEGLLSGTSALFVHDADRSEKAFHVSIDWPSCLPPH